MDASSGRGELKFLLQPAGMSASTQVASIDQLTGQQPDLPALDTRGIDFGRYFALVIGNNGYRHISKLEMAQNDARQVARTLEDDYGFKVKLLLDATRYDILSALNELRTTLTEQDNLLIYYAGHGTLEERNQRGYWLPIDAEETNNANWISNVDITDMLNAMNAKRILVIADSCYSGTLTRSSQARLAAGMTAEARRAWVETVAKKRARVALTSGGLTPVLDAGGGGNSVFARALLDVLRNNKGVLNGEDIYREVTVRVTYAAGAAQFEQVPQYAPIRYAGHEIRGVLPGAAPVEIDRWPPARTQRSGRGLTGGSSTTASALRSGRPKAATSISNSSPGCVRNPSEKLRVEVPKKWACTSPGRRKAGYLKWCRSRFSIEWHMLPSPDRNGFSQTTAPSRRMREVPRTSSGSSPMSSSGPMPHIRSLEWAR